MQPHAGGGDRRLAVPRAVDTVDTVGADGVGRDGGKKVAGRKGQVVDCLGLLLAVLLTAASVQGRDAAMPLLQRLRAGRGGEGAGGGERG